MWIIIVFVVFLAILMIALNQLLIRKFYWGPSGKPPAYKGGQEKKQQREDTVAKS